MKKLTLCFTLIIAFLLSDVKISFAQEASIYGRIFMPVVKKKTRTFRGRIYRNRLAAKKKIKKDEANERTVFEDVVIAAYPLSFRANSEPLKKARIIQKNAEFVPHVLPVTRGTRVQFINLDRFYHNIFSITPGAKFNIGRRPTGTVVSRTIYKKGFVKLFCDIHSQMNATIIGLDTPYFTQANRNGVYLLSDLPPGEYRIEILHPDFPEQINVITLKRDDKMEQSFTLTR